MYSYLQYAIYGVFAFWYLCSVPALIIVAQRLFWHESNPGQRGRPTIYYAFSFLFGVTATSILLWLYAANYLAEWPTIILGTLVFLPELLYSLWSQGLLSNARKVR